MIYGIRRLPILLAALLSLALAPAHAAFDESDAITAFRPGEGAGDPFDEADDVVDVRTVRRLGW